MTMIVPMIVPGTTPRKFVFMRGLRSVVIRDDLCSGTRAVDWMAGLQGSVW